MKDENTNSTAAGRVLIVDDVEVNRFVLRNIIVEMGYQPILAENGVQALKIIQRTLPELILLDISMPEMNGYEFAGIVKGDVRTRDIPIIFISAYDEVADIVKAFEIGGEDYITKPFIPEVVKARAGVQLKFHETKGNLKELNSKLQASLTDQLKQIESERKTVLYALANLARRNSLYEDYYMERLTFNCRIVAQALQIGDMCEGEITDNFIETLELAAPLCDLGNVAVPEFILQKKGELDGTERVIMQGHTRVGAKILQDIALSRDYDDFVKMAADIALYHHENWDGSGYPEGKKGNQIPLAAQIVSSVSVYCALTSNRSYRESYNKEEALNMIMADSGIKFNPEICEVCGKIFRQFK